MTNAGPAWPGWNGLGPRGGLLPDLVHCLAVVDPDPGPDSDLGPEPRLVEWS
jgi:hypothetical protein